MVTGVSRVGPVGVLLHLPLAYLFDHLSSLLNHNGLGLLHWGRVLVVVTEQAQDWVLVLVPVERTATSASSHLSHAGRGHKMGQDFLPADFS